MTKKYSLLGVCIITTSLILSGCGAKEGRMITLFDYNHKVELTRNANVVEVHKEMRMEDGDNIKTDDASEAKLNIDDSKILRIDEKSSVNLRSKGNSKKNQTLVELEYGTIYNEINKKIENKSSYKVKTSNTTISVHGTIFSVSEAVNEKGEALTKVNVFEGEVALEATDGTEKRIQGGSSAKVVTDKKGQVKIEEEPLAIDNLSLFEVSAIIDALDTRPLPFEKEELNKVKTRLEKTRNDDDLADTDDGDDSDDTNDDLDDYKDKNTTTSSSSNNTSKDDDDSDDRKDKNTSTSSTSSNNTTSKNDDDLDDRKEKNSDTSSPNNTNKDDDDDDDDDDRKDKHNNSSNNNKDDDNDDDDDRKDKHNNSSNNNKDDDNDDDDRKDKHNNSSNNNKDDDDDDDDDDDN